MCNVLLGCAIGDSLGLFAESQLPTYPELLNWDGKSFLPSKSHNLPATYYSDDTQFSICVAQSLLENSGFNPENLAEKYINLFQTNTIRGYGSTTLAAIRNLQSGKSYKESGIVGSLGNGSAMRAAPFGVFFRKDLKTLVEVVKIDSAITHNSEEAEAGSLAIAIASYYASNNDITNLLNKILPYLPDSKVKKNISSLDALITSHEITPNQALRVLGTSGDIRQTVPAALYAFIKFSSFHEAVTTTIRNGGDTDTIAAIVGSLFGACLGMQGIPEIFYQVENFEYLIKLDNDLYCHHLNRKYRS